MTTLLAKFLATKVKREIAQLHKLKTPRTILSTRAEIMKFLMLQELVSENMPSQLIHKVAPKLMTRIVFPLVRSKRELLNQNQL